MTLDPHVYELEELGELNRLFLGFLKKNAARNRDCLGLAAAAAGVLKAAPEERLASAADVPQALFRLRIDSRLVASTVEFERAVAEPVAYALRLTLLHSAWNMSRSSDYKARLLLGLTPQQVRALRVTPLSQLPALAHLDGLVSCAFGRSVWLWRRLLTETRPEMKRYLLLVVLQPHAARAANGAFARERARS